MFIWEDNILAWCEYAFRVNLVEASDIDLGIDA